jgi:hypothetical protein
LARSVLDVSIMKLEEHARTRSEWERILAGGSVAGVVGGATIALVLVVQAALSLENAWPVLKGASAPFLGAARAFQPGFDLLPVLLGTFTHFAISIAWSLVFASLVYGVSQRATALLGAAYGLVVWIGMHFVVLPMVGIAEYSRMGSTSMAILHHLIFGAAVGLAFAPFQRIDPALRPPRAAPPRPTTQPLRGMA